MMSETKENYMESVATLYNHSHDRYGALLEKHCCGCWVINYNNSGLYLECNECGERRDFADDMVVDMREAIGDPVAAVTRNTADDSLVFTHLTDFRCDGVTELCLYPKRAQT